MFGVQLKKTTTRGPALVSTEGAGPGAARHGAVGANVVCATRRDTEANVQNPASGLPPWKKKAAGASANKLAHKPTEPATGPSTASESWMRPQQKDDDSNDGDWETDPEHTSQPAFTLKQGSRLLQPAATKLTTPTPPAPTFAAFKPPVSTPTTLAASAATPATHKSFALPAQAAEPDWRAKLKKPAMSVNGGDCFVNGGGAGSHGFGGGFGGGFKGGVTSQSIDITTGKPESLAPRKMGMLGVGATAGSATPLELAALLVALLYPCQERKSCE